MGILLHGGCHLNGQSRFFAGLYEAYSAEVDDNRTDSEGKTVLQQRLKALRAQIDGYLPMMEESPEMVTVIFYDAFTFESVTAVRQAIGCNPDDAGFPTWSELNGTISHPPWAPALVSAALADPAGDRFLVIAACLEYLRSLDVSNPEHVEAESGTTERSGKDDDGDDLSDLGEEGDDWLSKQGFDSQR